PLCVVCAFTRTKAVRDGPVYAEVELGDGGLPRRRRPAHARFLSRRQVQQRCPIQHVQRHTVDSGLVADARDRTQPLASAWRRSWRTKLQAELPERDELPVSDSWTGHC